MNSFFIGLSFRLRNTVGRVLRSIPIVARLAGDEPQRHKTFLPPSGGFSFETLINNHMQNYITRDKLADFVEKMWDAGKRVDLSPEKSYLTVSDDSYGVEFVYVFEKRTYDALVEKFTKKEEPVDEQ